MIADLLRHWCRWRHRGARLRPAYVGGLRCSLCGAGFADTVDAGVIELITVKLTRFQIEEAEGKRAAFVPTVFRVIRGGKTVRLGRYRATGEPVEIAR